MKTTMIHSAGAATVAWLTLAALTFTLQADPILYATAGAGKTLVRIDVNATPDRRVVTLGELGVPAGDAIAINAKGEAFTVTHGWPPGGDSRLARVNLATARATTLGASLVPENFMGLGFAADGTLYSVNAGSGTPDAGSLYRFDPVTGAATKVGVTGGCYDIMDLAWAPDGTMYGAVNDSLYRIDLATGQATLATRLEGVSRVMGLAVDAAGTFYVSEIVPNAPLFRVDPLTGTTTKLFDTGVDLIHGLAVAPVAPPVIRPVTTFQNTAVYPGKGINFTAAATSVFPFTYQWRFQGEDLPGRTNRTLNLAAVQAADADDYTVAVGNPGGTTVSPPVRLWVVPPASEFQRHDFTNAAGARLPYLVHRPTAYDPARRYPLVFIVHGGCDWHEGVLPERFWDWPQVAVLASYQQQTHDPVLLVYPTHRQGMANCGWVTSEIALLAELLDWLVTELPVDEDRVYLSGGSSSLTACVELLRLRRDRWTAALLHSGSATAHPSLAGLPLWTFQTLTDGSGLAGFVQQLRSLGSHPLHTEFKTVSHLDVYLAQATSPAVTDWLLAQRRRQPTAGGPTVTIDRPDALDVWRTGATAVTLTGAVDTQGGDLKTVAWNNVTGRHKGAATGATSWQAGPVPLEPEATNTIVIAAAIDANAVASFEGTTTFGDTLTVFSTPVRLNLTRGDGQVTLDWTGGVSPFTVQVAPAVEEPGWTVLQEDAVPPVTPPAAGPAQFFRVLGR